jgi:hypothetical protein
LRHRARKILAGVLYVLMLGADLVVALFTLGVSGLIIGLWNFWLGVLGFTLLVSIVGAIVGPWRLRRHVALWYACIAVWYMWFTDVWQERPVLNDLLSAIALIGLLCACILPVVWLRVLPRVEP